MGEKTSIEWTDASWNFLRGCSRVSKGCVNCYAERIAARFSGDGMPYEGLAQMMPNGARWTGEVALIPDLLELPLRWKRPRRIFVNSMSDLFHESVPDSWIDQGFAVMALAKSHIFQILTKRPERMQAYLSRHDVGARWALSAAPIRTPMATPVQAISWTRNGLPNVWLGVSVEDQKTADERIPLLLQTPAAVRWISAEPLLGAIDLAHLRDSTFDALTGRDYELLGVDETPKLDWVVVGGESGHGARPMHPDWARSLRDQCVAAGVKYFFKQVGEWAWEYPQGLSLAHREQTYQHGMTLYRVGKKAAGRSLDGREWDEMPEINR